MITIVYFGQAKTDSVLQMRALEPDSRDFFRALNINDSVIPLLCYRALSGHYSGIPSSEHNIGQSRPKSIISSDFSVSDTAVQYRCALKKAAGGEGRKAPALAASAMARSNSGEQSSLADGHGPWAVADRIDHAYHAVGAPIHDVDGVIAE